MSGQSKGFILGIVAAALIGAAAVIIVTVASGGGDDTPETAVAQTQAPAPTAAPTTAPSATSVPPTAPPPTQPPPPPPPTEPPIRSCAEIRASGTYNSEAERQFFLASCQQTAAARPTSPPAAAAQPQPQPAAQPQPSGPSEEEQSYVRRASQVNLQYVARLRQYWQQPSFGALADLYELASIALNHANALDAVQPVPDRFRPAHNNLVGSLLAFRDHILKVNNVGSLPEFLTWVAGFERLGDTVDTALVNWQIVVGVQTTPLGGLR